HPRPPAGADSRGRKPARAALPQRTGATRPLRPLPGDGDPRPRRIRRGPQGVRPGPAPLRGDQGTGAAAGQQRGRSQALCPRRAAAAVSHEHVVAIYGVDEADGLPYLVMEYVAGISLQERIERTGLLELADVLRIGRQAASGLAAAHAQGLVHRDIKPANILLE